MPTRRRAYEETAHRRAFGERVRHLRVERGWTQEQMAEQADLHRSYVASIESGARNPTLDVIVKIADALHVAVPDLFR